MQRECSNDVYMAIPKTGEEADDNAGTVIKGSMAIATKGSTRGKNTFSLTNKLIISRIENLKRLGYVGSFGISQVFVNIIFVQDLYRKLSSKIKKKER